MPRPKRQKVEHKQEQNSENNTMSSSHAWADLTSQLEPAIKKVNQTAKNDEQLKNFMVTNAITQPATFGIRSSGSENTILVTVTNGNVELTTGSKDKALFTLVATPEQWQEFMKQTPVAPYQSYWGMAIHSVLMYIVANVI